MTTSQFDNIYHGLSVELGKIRLASTGIAWKALQGDATATIASGNIKWAQWLRVARNFQLRVGLKDNRRRETFDGFQREDHDKLATLFKQYDVILETKDISFKGWNWGTTDFQGEDLAFLVSNKTAFEVPMKYVANSNIAGKTEVSLEFAPMEDKDKKPTKGRSIDELVEMRFYVPGVIEKTGSDNEGENKADGDGDEDDDEEQSAAQVFHDAIRDRAEIGQGIMGDSIVLFEDVLIVTPRGRYDIDMFEDFMRLRGKKYDYKIMYSQITRLFLLPKADEIHVQFIIGLEPPIRQGQTKYPYLVTMFSRDQELEIDLNLDDEVLNTKYDGKLDKHYETATYQVVSTVFRGLTGKKITGTSSFQSVSGHPSIKCNWKAAQGELFVLEKMLFFVTKQPKLIQFDDIHQVVFSRLGSARTIDVKVIAQTGPEIVFSGVNKEEHEMLEEFLKGKKVRTKNELGDEMLAAALGDDGDDDDEEMQSVASDDEEPARPRAANGDDEDSEEDEDFQASSSDEGSPSEDSDEDSDEASDASDDMVKEATKTKTKTKAKAKDKDGSPSAPKKKKKKAAEDDDSAPKKKKAKKPDADDAMDVDAPAPKPKPKPKPKTDDADEPAKKKLKRE